jgi:hypothetical protein
MKKILRRSKHFLRAKGRHGTHSPFVYAFVEQVLRNKNRFRLNHEVRQKGFTRKELNLLARTIGFLQPSGILADEHLMPLLKEIIPAIKREDILLEDMKEGYLKQPDQAKKLIVTLCYDNPSLALLQQYLKQPEMYVLVVKPHATKAAEENWFALSDVSQVNMRLDLWHLGLLINDAVFKASQSFKLR